LKHGEIMPKPESLQRLGATELLGEALARGAACSTDFSQIDHLTMADWPLAQVREFFNVIPLAVPQY
jgi:hypothetical protein